MESFSSNFSTTFSTQDHVSQSQVQSRQINKQTKVLFRCEMNNKEFLLPILKSINIDQYIEMIITERGIKFICENFHSIQATTFIDRQLFSKYEIANGDDNDDCVPHTLRIYTQYLLNNLSFLLTERFNKKIINKLRNRQNQQQQPNESRETSTLLIKYYQDKRLKMKIITKERLFTSCLQTLEIQKLNVWTMAFVNRITIDASVMTNFWKFADNDSEFIMIEIKNDAPWFVLSTKSERGRFSKQIDSSSPHIEHYECTIPSSYYYRMRIMKHTVQPLLLANKINIRFNANGLLNMQFFIPLDSIDNNDSDLDEYSRQQTLSDSHRCFVEFYIIPVDV